MVGAWHWKHFATSTSLPGPSGNPAGLARCACAAPGRSRALKRTAGISFGAKPSGSAPLQSRKGALMYQRRPYSARPGSRYHPADPSFRKDMKNFRRVGAAALLLWGLAAQAQFVDPSLRWRTLDTEHFSVHFAEH